MASNTCYGCSVSALLSEIEFMSPEGQELIYYTVALPDLIAHTNMDTQAVTRLKEEIFKMLQFLVKNVGTYLNRGYVPAGPPEELESS